MNTARPLAGSAVAGLGLLAVGPAFPTHVAAFGPPGTEALTTILPPVVAALALVVWHRAWAWLLVAGALCAVPVAVHAAFGGGQDPLVLTLAACVPPLALVGVLGAATLVSRAGRPEAGAALAGTATAAWLTGPQVATAIVVALGVPAAVLTVTLVVGAIAGSVVTVTARPPASTAPSWGVTAVAVVAVLAPPLLIATGFGDHRVLAAGFVAVGLAAAAVVGRPGVLGALSAGLLLGVVGAASTLADEMVHVFPVEWLVVGLGALVLGCWLALSPVRLGLGFAGLLVAAACGGFLITLTGIDAYVLVIVVVPFMVLVAGVATATVTAAVGAEFAPRAAAPAVLVGLTAPFAHAPVALLLDGAAYPDLLGVVVVGGLVVAAVALLGLRRAFRVSATSPADAPGRGGTRR